MKYPYIRILFVEISDGRLTFDVLRDIGGSEEAAARTNGMF